MLPGFWKSFWGTTWLPFTVVRATMKAPNNRFAEHIPITLPKNLTRGINGTQMRLETLLLEDIDVTGYSGMQVKKASLCLVHFQTPKICVKKKVNFSKLHQLWRLIQCAYITSIHICIFCSVNSSFSCLWWEACAAP